MRVLLLGGGGREHALGWKLAQSPRLDGLVSAPGNPGLDRLGEVVPEVDPSDVDAVVSLAASAAVDLVVVGPEAPLVAGVVDGLHAAGIRSFGPTADAARLESSKAFAKEVMVRAGVPTAESRSFDEVEAAVRHLRASAPPYVVKADGLAAGKGVLVTPDPQAAEAWASHCLQGGFGEAGATVVVEEHLEGRELSVFAICDGAVAVPLEPARDYKRLGDGGTGPNTGGMGCFSPVADVPDGLVAGVMDEVVAPVLAVMAELDRPYRGFLYVGLMLTDDGPKVLEFNCRLGDPETQVVLPRLDADLVELLSDAADGRLAGDGISWSDRAAVDVVLASRGYPGSPDTGHPVGGLDEAAAGGDVLVFHAGTSREDGRIVTSGGRVLNVVGLGDDLAAARAAAYEAAGMIEFEGKQMRGDIAS